MNSWNQFLAEERKKSYFVQLEQYLSKRLQMGKVIYPPSPFIFKAFEWTPFEKVRVVIVGQDPYHEPNQAHGLAFSVPEGVIIPPSLKNIYNELLRSIDGFVMPKSGFLKNWAKQGVLLLNRVLTVEKGAAHAHQNQGWEHFTTSALNFLCSNRSGILFLLWGADAQSLAKEVDFSKQRVFTTSHPSPLSAHRGFLGCNHFLLVNQILQERGEPPIDWQI